MALRKLPNSQCWVFQCKVNGRTWSRSTGQADLRKAEEEVPKLEKLAQLHREQPNGSLTLNQAIVQEVAIIEQDISESRAERVSYALVPFRKFAKNIPLEKIDKDLIEKYQRKRLGEVSRSTVELELCTILRMLRRYEYHVSRPSPKKGKRTDVRSFMTGELQDFFKACPKPLKTLYALLLCTGARPAELVPSARSSHKALLKTEVDLEGKTVSIRSAKNRGGATGKTRVLPLSEELIPALKEQIKSNDGVFVFAPLPNGPRDFDSVLDLAGIPKLDELGHKLTAHSFRHTYATLMAEATGNNPFILKEILGHQRLSTTERYCHPTAPSILPSMKSIFSSN